jgi:hypothetical protein
MSHPDHSSDPLCSRRDLLKTVGATTAAASVGAILGDKNATAGEPTPSGPASDQANRHRLGGINPKNLVDEYERRELDAVGDADLCQQAAAIVSRPPVKGGSSFTLHAPLELLARYGLLPLVDPRERSLARLQLVASAAAFESGTTGGDPPAKIDAFPNPKDAKAEFTRVFEKGDANGLEAIVLQLAAQYGTASLVQLLTPLALPTLSGASHSHIGLWLLLRHGRSSDIGDAALLRAAARSLANDPKGRLKSFGGMAITGDKPLKDDPAQVERDVLAKLKAPKRGEQAYGSMRTLVTAGEATGNADALFLEFIRHDLTNEQIDAAFRAILRICAHNMLQHDAKFAKFGWSHCLTLPQAACGLSSFNIDRKLALATALVWITAYRSVLSDHDLDLHWAPTKLKDSPSLKEALQTSSAAAAARVWYAEPAELASIRQTLATEALIRTDQHLNKYTRACMDMASFDPRSERLYLAAAAHLCSIWVKEDPESKIKDQLLKGRKGT